MARMAMMRRWTAVAVVAVLAVCSWPTPASALPRPEDAVLVVTTTTASPSASASAAPTPALPAAAPTPAETAVSAESQKAKTPPPQVRSLHVNSQVQYRYAHTVVSSRVANPANQSQEVTFSVVLPETAFISTFAMEVDGKVYKAYVKEKKEAKQTYDAAVAAGQSAAHVAVSARDSNSFTVSLNVESQNKVSFNLTYEELLTRKLGLYNHVVTLNPGQVVQDLEVRVHIKENKNITKLRVPEFSSGNKIDNDLQECDDNTEAKPTKCASGNNMATITWKTPSDVEVLFRPSEDDQREIMDKLDAKKKKEREEAAALLGNGRPFGAMRWADAFQPSDDDAGDKNKDDGLNGQFSVEYDVDRAADGGEVVVNDGYFVHFFSPSELKPLKKHAIFVLDVSGSMDGRKIEQLREAMMAILDDLKDGDYFNLIQFSSDVKVWNLDDPNKSFVTRANDGWNPSPTEIATPPAERPPAYRATKENIEKAKSIVKHMGAYGGTNIFDALKTALDCARDGARSAPMSDAGQPLEPIILFLTDGDPTVGVTVPTKITAGISELNLKPRSAVFSLAFGEGADIKFLRKISLANAGFARTIYEAADASLQLKNFYRQISSPLLANVSFQYIPEKVEQDSMTQLSFRTFFDGTELVVAGRTADKGIQEVGGGVKAVADGGKHATYTPHTVPIDYTVAAWPFDFEGPVFNHTQAPRQVTVLERLWAYLTIKQLLDKQDALDASTADEDVIKPVWVPTGGGPVALPAVNVAAPATDAPTDAPTTASTTPAVNASDLDLSVFQPEPKQRALELALKYSFVTPLTSLVVVKPNETKTTDAHAVNPADSANAAALQGGVVPLSLAAAQGPGTTMYSKTFANRIAPIAASIMTLGLATVDPWAAAAAPAATAAADPGYSSALLSPSGNVSSYARNWVTRRPFQQAMSTTTRTTMTTMTATTESSLRIQDISLDIRVSAIAQQQEEEEGADVDLSLDRLDSFSEPLPVVANISDVKWLPKDALIRGTVVLPLNGTDKTYKISDSETDPVPPQPCQVPGDVTTQGVCRHFAHCVLGQIVERIEDFVKYQCAIGDYLAICCPLHADPTVQPVTQSSTPTV